MIKHFHGRFETEPKLEKVDDLEPEAMTGTPSSDSPLSGAGFQVNHVKFWGCMVANI